MSLDILPFLNKLEERFGKWTVDIVLILLWSLLVLSFLLAILLILVEAHLATQRGGASYFIGVGVKVVVALISWIGVMLLGNAWSDRKLNRTADEVTAQINMARTNLEERRKKVEDRERKLEDNAKRFVNQMKEGNVQLNKMKKLLAVLVDSKEELHRRLDELGIELPDEDDGFEDWNPPHLQN